MTSPILAEYDDLRSSYDAFRTHLASLLPQLLFADNIQPHKIESRLKSRQSLEKKIGRTEKSYSKLADITDICGIRLITYFAADVDAIATILEREFEIDRANSIDKRQYTDPDRFGYASLHYVISLSTDRAKLTECASWRGYKAEVQVRTIIQHAWAEIEHDLGFKSSTAVPREIRRRFSRLSALLETADDEFAGIKNDLTGYTAKVSAELKTPQPNVAIDGPSIHELIKSDSLVVECEIQIAKRSNRPLLEADPHKCSLLADYLHTVGITTVSALHDFLRPNKDAIVAVAVERLLLGSGAVGAGITLLYTCYGVLARSGDVDAFVRFLDTHRFAGKQSNRDFATDVIAAFNAHAR